MPLDFTTIKEAVNQACNLFPTETNPVRAGRWLRVLRLARICFAVDLDKYGLRLLRAFLGFDGAKEFRKEINALCASYARQDFIGVEKMLKIICGDGAKWLRDSDAS